MLGNQVVCWRLLSCDSQRHINCALETSARNGPTVKAMTVVGEVEEGKKNVKRKEKKKARRPSVTSCDTQQKAARSPESILVTMQTAA